MPFIIRHLQPLCRSRKRFSFLLIISLLVCIAFILFTIDSNTQQSIGQDSSLIIKKENQNIILNKLQKKSTINAQK